MAKEQKGARRKRRSSWLVLLNGFLTLVVLAIIAGGFVVYWGISEINKPGPKDADAAFLVSKGSGLGSLGSTLQDQGFIGAEQLVPGSYLFRLMASMSYKDAKVLPGQYLIPAHASISQILALITTTKPQEFFLNVVPGETSWEVAQQINDPGQALTGAQIAVPIEGTLLAVRHDFFPATHASRWSTRWKRRWMRP